MVSKIARITLALALIGAVGGAAYAEEKEQDWPKKEEPALRPYKALWRGVKAVVHHSKESFIEGNTTVPILGTVEVFRGVRRGGIELVTGTYQGMAGTPPRPVEAVGKTNQIIDADPALKLLTDVAVPMGLAATVTTTHTALEFGVGAAVAQKVVDSDPLADRFMEDDERADDRVADAQKRYVGERAEINKKKNGTGNLLELARKD